MYWVFTGFALAAVAFAGYGLGRRRVRCNVCRARLHGVCLNQRCGGHAMAAKAGNR